MTDKGNEEAKKVLDELCDNWKGTYSSDLKIAVGAATLKDVNDRQMEELCKYADKCMYKAKSEWYNSTGVNRRTIDLSKRYKGDSYE